MKVLALADDATGALETGARFRSAGLPARVRFTPEVGPAALVIDTESRHLPAEQAYQRVRDIACRARAAERVFKKTDSTLRGPMAAEFRALLEVWPARPLVYVPAYPALGRTVRNGELFVDGVPLGRTAFAADLLNPSAESCIAAVLGGCEAEIVLARDAGEVAARIAPGRILVCDGETDEDLRSIARAIGGEPCLVAGTAAMASAWAASFCDGPRLGPVLPTVERCLVVCGSLHPASRRQVEETRMPALSHDFAADSEELGMRLAQLVEEHGWAAMVPGAMVAGDPLAVAAHAGRTVARALGMAAPDCLAVFGGDTVFAILSELGIAEAEPLGEILPGVPVSTVIRDCAPMLLVTKAGGFGGADYLLRIREILEKA